MKKTTFLRKLNFLIALGGVFAAAAFYGCGNLFSSIDSASDSPVNLAQPREGYGIVSGNLPSSDSASARTAMPSKPDETTLSFKVFAQSGSQKIEANVNEADRTFSLSLPFGTWAITANGMVADGRTIFTQTQTVTLSEENATAFLRFELGYSTNPDDGDGEISLSVSFPPKSDTSAIRGIEYVLSRGEEKIVQNVSDAELGAGKFKIGLATENLGAWHLTILFYGDFSNLVYRIDQTVNVYANLTTDTFEGSAPYISGGAIAVTQALLEDFQNTTLYVNATSGKDTNTGTQFDPLQTFNRALELVNNSTRSADTEFRIFLQTDVADGATLELKRDKKLTIASAGADGTTRTITSLGRTFIVSSGSELTVQSVAFEKLRFEISGTFAMDGGEISGNTASNGGAICINAGGKATVANTKIHDNTANNKGGGVYVGGSAKATLTNCAIKSCETTVTTVGDGGGGIYSLGTLTVTGGTISDCIAGRSGGGIYAYGGTVECSDGVAFSNCEATGSGSVGSGGGICINKDVKVDVSDCTFVSCTANASGGGIWNAGELDVSNTSFTTCSAINKGGGICNDGGKVTMSGTAKITGNNASDGGGVAVNSGTFTMKDGEISGNRASNKGGGGVYVDGDASASSSFTMKDGTISNNTADGSKGSGGGVYVYNGTFTMEGGKISDNTAKGVDGESFGGGGIYLYRTTTSMPGGKFTLKGGTVSGNEAEYGGGIWAGSFSEFAMEGGAFGGNKSAKNGNGAYVNPCTFKMSGVAQFAKDDDVYLNDSNQSLFATITVAGALTAESPVATITPSTYDLDRQVLSKGGSVAEITPDICNKFVVTDSDDAEWSIIPDGTGANGVLKTKMDIYVRGSNATWYESNAPTAADGSDNNSGLRTKPFATIQKAVDTVLDRNDGTSEYTIYLDGTFTAASSDALADFTELSQPLSLKILGLSASKKAVLDGNGTASGIVVGSYGARKDMNLTLENLTVQNVAGKGITLYCKSTNSHTIKNCDIKNNAGTGIYHYYGSLDLQDCTVSGNTNTGDGGGIYSTDGPLTMTNCSVSKNGAKSGAGIYFYPSSNYALTMKDCAISENTATSVGGGVYAWHNENVTLEGCTISGNTATSFGGGAYFNANRSSSPVMKDCTVSGNEASKGNGAYLYAYMRTLKLMLDGTTKFAKDDDIYLVNQSSGSSTVGVMNTLTTPAPVATITPSTYETVRQVLSAGTGVTIDEDICGKFALSEEGWQILPKPGDSTAGVLVSTDTSTIYLDSYNGDDANFGLSASNAVKTLSKAIELYDAYDAQKIMVCKVYYTLASEESDLLDRAGKSKLTLMRYDGSSEVSDVYTRTLLCIDSNSGNVTITNVTLDGNKDNVTATGSLLYILGGNVTLGDGATICNNKTSYNSDIGGSTVYIQSPGTLTMMEGAKITGNESTDSGHCVYVNAYGTFNMTGGEITGNTANKSGGGVYNSSSTFNMSGGKISENTANNNGGGVCNSGTFTMTGGEITNNNATEHGGGVYNTRNSTFTQGGTVSDNTPDDVYKDW
ncbi:MAG: right-handed parallel beta-helix repeat-containing protein [Treponema sp.]|nr:right-handed parallel beta-helix repeat-containing protein [Treponema sp.]